MNRSIRVRSAEPSDARAAAEVHCRSAILAYADMFPVNSPKPSPSMVRADWLAAFADQTSVSAVAETTSGTLALVGAVAAAKTSGSQSQIWLQRLYVEPHWWGRGVGSLLHDWVVDAARRSSAAELRLWVLEPNTEARRMYERWGWTLVPGERLANGDTGIDDVQYRLVL